MGPGSDDSGSTDDSGGSGISPDQNDDGKLDALPGCDVGDDLCDLISDVPGDEDDALQKEEVVSKDVFEGLVDGLRDDEVELPLIDYGTLARLIGSGLLPRNVDAPGRSLFNYNNLLVDTVFERLPLRQFSPVEITAEVEDEAVIVDPDPEMPQEPIRGLWSRAEAMEQREAQDYVDQTFAKSDELLVEEELIRMDGATYVENQSVASQYADRGVRAWYRAFGGDTGPTQTSALYGDYNASAGGMILGADVSIAQTFKSEHSLITATFH